MHCVHFPPYAITFNSFNQLNNGATQKTNYQRIEVTKSPNQKAGMYICKEKKKIALRENYNGLTPYRTWWKSCEVNHFMLKICAQSRHYITIFKFHTRKKNCLV